MKCPRCQQENPAGQKFCGECGARLTAVCPACGASNSPGQKFCGECGASLSQGAAAGKFASPETYTPQHLAEKILTSKSALEGERKQVTVLFADLKGSMELLADRDPEEARKILDPVLERMMEAVHHYEGTVNQVMGDGIMALFGAPIAHEDHAVRACYAALRMQEAVKRYGDEARRLQGVNVQIRVGLNSGEVVVRAIGSDLRMDYSAVGQTTHLAARMEQLASPGSIFLTMATLRHAEGYVEIKPLGLVPVKGLSEPVEVYEATGAGAVRSRFQAAAARGLSRFVGRDAEVEQLRKALEQARTGRGQLVAVIGEPGVGKSRLFYEFVHSHRTQGWLILQASSVSHGKATSYLPVIDLLKAYFKVHDRETHREIREKVAGKLMTLDRALEPALPALLALLDVPVEDAQWAALDPLLRRRRTHDAVKRLLLRESQEQPLLVIFEDLHWIDGETAALLDGLIEGLPTARFLLLVNYRPEYQHASGSKTYYTQLRLDVLPPESADELLLALLGTDITIVPLKPLLIARTGGNPLFLEESVRTLVETNALIGRPGAYQLARPLDPLDTPATVQAILASRIDRLDPQDKKLLQTASVVGKDVPLALLLAVAEMPEEDLRQGLAHLQAAEFLYEASLFPDLEYTFNHALTHEVAYGSLLQERRRSIHAAVVEAIERRYAGRLSEQADRLAHHATRAEAWEKAVTHLWQAGRNARSRSAYREAVAFLEQALEILKQLPQTADNAALHIDLLCRDLSDPLASLQRYQPLLAHLAEAALLAERVGDRARLSDALARSVLPLRRVGELDRAVEAGERALALAQEVRDAQLSILAGMELGSAYFRRGDMYRAETVLTQALASLDGLPPATTGPHTDWLRRRILMGLTSVFTATGRHREAVQRGEDAVRLAEDLGHPAPIAGGLYVLGAAHCCRGDADKAISLCTRSLALGREWEVQDVIQPALVYLGTAYIQAGRVDEALLCLEEAITVGEAANSVETFTLIALGEAQLLSGHGAEAVVSEQRALSSCRKQGQRGNEAEVLRLLAEIASRRDPPSFADAETHYRPALAVAGELGMRPLLAHCHLGLGKLYQRTGQREQAQEHLTTSTTMYREMGMTYWLDKAEKELGELG